MDDAVTCGTCLTLNPPGVPACLRCNSPLATPRPSAVSAPPLAAPPPVPPAAPPRAAPARRSAATGRAGAPDGRQGGLSPADQRRVLRRIEVVGGAVVLLVLAAGGWLVWNHRPRTLDTGSVARTVQAQLSQRLGQPVSVRCPDTAARARGTTFSCTATEPAGARRTVVVTVTGDDGSYQWQLR